MSRAVLDRLARDVAALEQAEADRRARAWAKRIDLWLSSLSAAWTVPSAQPPADRAAARERLESCRALGAIYVEEGVDGLRACLAALVTTGPDGEPATGLPPAEQDAVIAWAGRLWPPGSRHPFDPDRPHQQIGALDAAPPAPAVVTAWRTRAQVFAHAPGDPQPVWPETRAGITAHLCFTYVVEGEGDAGRQAVAGWLTTNGIHTKAKATQQARGLAEDIAELRQIAAASGYAAVRAEIMDWYAGTTEAEADRILGCAGIAADPPAERRSAPAPAPDSRPRGAPDPPVAAPATSAPALASPTPPVVRRPAPTPAPLRRVNQPDRRRSARERLAARYGPEEPRHREIDGYEILRRLSRF
ncbi:MAG: hypothetical protein AB7U18_10575 [Dehalococcoidia bacterium]